MGKGRFGIELSGIIGLRGNVDLSYAVNGDNIMTVIDVQPRSLGLPIQCYDRLIVGRRNWSTKLAVVQNNMRAFLQIMAHKDVSGTSPIRRSWSKVLEGASKFGCVVVALVKE